MTIDFYYTLGSAPCRNVLLAAKALNIQLNLKDVNLMKGEHMTPEFIKMNPQHTVPTLDDNGFIVTESRAAMTYLASRYRKGDKLYPEDPEKRAVIDQRLYFDMGTLYLRFGELYYPMLFAGQKYSDEKAKKLDEALGFLDTFLSKTGWAAGDDLTLADLALVSSVSTIDSVGHDLSKFANVTKWFQKCKTTIVGYKEANGDGADQFKAWFNSTVKK